jgi:hypothetical protein
MALVLFGNWTPKPDGYGYYRPLYATDKKNTDLISKKKIQSDVVRIITMHVEGLPRYINFFLQSLDTDQLYRIISE